MADAASRARLVARPWRIAFVLYALLLTVATHWPELALGPEMPATDKTIHLAAFGLLTGLAWRTGWLRRRWAVAVACALWAVVDEVSQGIPILNRWVTWEDGAANMLGVAVVGVWLWATRPIGGPVNRLRLRRRAFIFDETFVRPMTWGGLLAVAIAAAGLFLWIRSWPANPTAWPATVTILAWAIASARVVTRQFARESTRAARLRPCLECGHGLGATAASETDPDRCPSCGVTVATWQWSTPPAPSARTRVAMSTRAAALGLVAVAAIFLIVLASAPIYAALISGNPSSDLVPSVIRLVVAPPEGLVRTVDIASFLALAAVLVRLYRGGLARYYDQAIRCRRCGHDLSMTPDHDGHGRCGECGCPFERSVGLSGPTRAVVRPRRPGIEGPGPDGHSTDVNDLDRQNEAPDG